VSETVTVKSFSGGNDWTSDDGKIALTYYDCVFSRAGADFEANWGKKQGTGDPPIGEPIEGEFYQKNGKWKFRKTSKPQGSNTGGSSAGKSREWKSESQYDPEKVARISRAHAQKMAVQTMTAMGTFESKSADQIHGMLKNWIDWFQADVDKAAAKAAQGTGSAQASTDPAVAGSVPDGVPGPVPAQDFGVHERLSTLLEGAGVNGSAARLITDYLINERSTQEQDAAIERLQNPNMAPACVKRCSELAEQHYGEPLPTATADDDIPF
jgi:hypothetical protein